MEIAFRLGTPAEFSALADLWRRSVRATHDFLTSADIDQLYGEVRDQYLAGVELHVAETDGLLAGFMGLSGCQTGEPSNGCKVEMLFIDPAMRGKGVGSALLLRARKLYGPLAVDVNEQNPAALGFYEAQGFRVVGRSPLDGQGRSFPLLHLKE